jgi:hypothetical protein
MDDMHHTHTSTIPDCVLPSIISGLKVLKAASLSIVQVSKKWNNKQNDPYFLGLIDKNMF